MELEDCVFQHGGLEKPGLQGFEELLFQAGMANCEAIWASAFVTMNWAAIAGILPTSAYYHDAISANPAYEKSAENVLGATIGPAQAAEASNTKLFGFSLDLLVDLFPQRLGDDSQVRVFADHPLAFGPGFLLSFGRRMPDCPLLIPDHYSPIPLVSKHRVNCTRAPSSDTSYSRSRCRNLFRIKNLCDRRETKALGTHCEDANHNPCFIRIDLLPDSHDCWPAVLTSSRKVFNRNVLVSVAATACYLASEDSSFLAAVYLGCEVSQNPFVQHSIENEILTEAHVMRIELLANEVKKDILLFEVITDLQHVR